MTAIFCLSGQDLTMDTLVDRAEALAQLDCTGSIRKVLARAVEWKPQRRFANAAEMVHALRDALDDPSPNDDEVVRATAAERHAEEIQKILAEADVYMKYGLNQKAINHLRHVFTLDAESYPHKKFGVPNRGPARFFASPGPYPRRQIARSCSHMEHVGNRTAAP